MKLFLSCPLNAKINNFRPSEQDSNYTTTKCAIHAAQRLGDAFDKTSIKEQ